MLQALAEVGLVPDLVVGTSVGSFNGALLAEDPRGAANRLTHLWLRMKRETVFPGGAVDHLRTWHRGRTYLVRSDGLRELLTHIFGDRNLKDLELPFAAMATDLATGRAVRIESGSLVEALLASTAVPGLYPQVNLDGRDLVDGGVVNNVPVKDAVEMGARSIVVLDCGVFGFRPTLPTSLPETIAHVVAIMMRQQVARDVAKVARTVPLLYLPGPFPLTSSPLEFRASRALMADAYEASREFLAEIEPAGPGLYGDPPLLPARDKPETREARS
jgi:NTE family protein